MAEPELVEVTLIRGSIRTDAPVTIKTSGGKKEVVTKAPGEVRTYGPGEKVKVAAADLKALIARGMIVDPAAAPIEVGPGPNFTPQGGGPTITETA